MENLARTLLPEPDARRLTEIAEGIHGGARRDQDGLARLSDALEQAKVVSSEELPPDVVSMHSTVRIADVGTGEESTYTLVYPASADAAARKLSILAPIGLAVLGRREGEEVQPQAPGGVRRLRILKVEHQPERAMAERLRTLRSALAAPASDAPRRRLA
jgi:regulator of nucleoside diphosphate kinase